MLVDSSSPRSPPQLHHFTRAELDSLMQAVTHTPPSPELIPRSPSPQDDPFYTDTDGHEHNILPVADLSLNLSVRFLGEGVQRPSPTGLRSPFAAANRPATPFTPRSPPHSEAMAPAHPLANPRRLAELERAAGLDKPQPYRSPRTKPLRELLDLQPPSVFDDPAMSAAVAASLAPGSHPLQPGDVVDLTADSDTERDRDRVLFSPKPVRVVPRLKEDPVGRGHTPFEPEHLEALFRGLQFSAVQVHLPLLSMQPAAKLITINHNPGHVTNLAPRPQHDESAELSPDRRKPLEAIKQADKQARRAVNERNKAEREQTKAEEVLGEPASPSDLARAPSPVSPLSKKAKEAAAAALRGDSLEQSEDESTESDAVDSDQEFVEAHPDDISKLEQLEHSPPPAPMALIGERDHEPAALPPHLEPGVEVDEQSEGEYEDDDDGAGGKDEKPSAFIDVEAGEAEDTEMAEEEYDLTQFFWAVPADSSTGKQKLHVFDDSEEQHGTRLANEEEIEWYDDHA